MKLTRADVAGANVSQDFSRINVSTSDVTSSSQGLNAAESLESSSSDRDPSGNGNSGLPKAATYPFSSPNSANNLRSMSDTRKAKFRKVLDGQIVDLEALRELCWSGIPHDLRPICWQLLLGYLPPNRDRREHILARKRQEYADQVREHFNISPGERGEDDAGALRQVSVDVPRTAPGVAFFHQEPVQRSLERILYIWGIRHPASGYVQGINDLVTPFLTVFLSQHFEGPMEEWQVDSLSEATVTEVEADSYCCLCRLLEGIQDHYTHAQPGIQRMVFSVRELVRRIDEPISQHMETENLEFLQFSFRWVNCLLLREVPFLLSLRLWDTYLAEGPRMKDFLKYVLAAFLLYWSAQLSTMDFQDMVLFLQRLPTNSWTEKEIETILSRAYMWRATFDDAQSHLTEH